VGDVVDELEALVHHLAHADVGFGGKADFCLSVGYTIEYGGLANA
jgi:hypothetical protein